MASSPGITELATPATRSMPFYEAVEEGSHATVEEGQNVASNLELAEAVERLENLVVDVYDAAICRCRLSLVVAYQRDNHGKVQQSIRKRY
jgi:hypothetical protein